MYENRYNETKHIFTDNDSDRKSVPWEQLVFRHVFSGFTFSLDNRKLIHKTQWGTVFA